MQIDHNLLKYNFYSTVIADIFKAVDGGSFGGAFILSFCCIDYLGRNLAIQESKAKNDKNDYKDFIKIFMAKVNLKYSNLPDQLYAIRCSLVHTYGESEASLTLQVTPQFLFGDLMDDHLRLDQNKKKLHISLSAFIGELVTATEMFFNERMIPTNSTTEWSAKLFYPQNLSALIDRQSIKQGNPINYKSIHPFLEILEKEKDFNKIYLFIKDKVEEKINAY